VRRAFRGLLAAGALAAAAGALPAHAAAAPLPDGRAYELVSPLQSRGIDVSSAWTMPDGEHAISLAKINDPQGLRIATRTADGWSTKRVGLDPPAANRKLNTMLIDVADDLSRLAVEATAPNDTPRDQVWVQTLADGSWAHVGGKVRFAGGSSDLSTVVVVPSTAAADPYPALASGSRVFRWHDGAVASIGDDARRVAVCGAVVADGGGARTADQNGVSADGRTVVLTSLSAGADGCRDPRPTRDTRRTCSSGATARPSTSRSRSPGRRTERRPTSATRPTARPSSSRPRRSWRRPTSTASPTSTATTSSAER